MPPATATATGVTAPKPAIAPPARYAASASRRRDAQIAGHPSRRRSPPPGPPACAQKIDTAPARAIYGRRLAIVEPVFANLRSNKRLDRFTYRGLAKVSVQWLLYCLVHNIEKLAHLSRKYAPAAAPPRPFPPP